MRKRERGAQHGRTQLIQAEEECDVDGDGDPGAAAAAGSHTDHVWSFTNDAFSLDGVADDNNDCDLDSDVFFEDDNVNNNANKNSPSKTAAPPPSQAAAPAAGNGGASPAKTLPTLVVPSANGKQNGGPLTPTTPSICVESVDGGGPHEPTQEEIWAAEEERLGPYRLFGPESFVKLQHRALTHRLREEERKNNVGEGKLVDGELKFGNEEEDEEEQRECDPYLAGGNYLDENEYGDVPKGCFGKPLEEIDHYIKDMTFVIISKRFKKKLITRFSATKAFFLLSPWNPIRKGAVLIVTHQIFEYIIMLTILVNICLMAPGDEEKYWINITEYVFTVIYSFECIVKLLARGAFLHKYSYFRDGWNWLDFIVVILAYVSIFLELDSGANSDVSSVSTLKAFRVLRVLRTLSVFPGLKTIVSAFFKSMQMLAEVMLLTIFCMFVFALFALQVYSGVLRQKCVSNIPLGIEVTEKYWQEHIKNDSNWALDQNEEDWLICGNASGAGRCPKNYTCLPDIGDNPNFGYTNFDNIGMSLLTSFQLITLDFWEDTYSKILRANGPWNILFFIAVVFFGSFYLINLMLAVVSMSYDMEAAQAKKDKDRAQDAKKSKEKNKKKKPAGAVEAGKPEETGTDTTKKPKDTTHEESNHLQVMAAINGSTASSTSLNTSVGNGVIKPAPNVKAIDSGLQSKNNDKNLNANKTVDNKSGRNVKNNTSKNNQNEITPITLENEQGNKKHQGKLGIAKLGTRNTHSNDNDDDGYINPLATITPDDTNSIVSMDNDGDPPIPLAKDDEDDDDDELVDRNCACCGRCCTCYIRWLKIQRFLYKIVSDLIFELFITFCILLNVLFMSMEHQGMSQEFEDAMTYGNYVFTGIFTMEAILKMLALSKHYFKSSWNIFDLVIVTVSLVDLVVDQLSRSGVINSTNLGPVTAIRLFRIMRIFKLAQSWSTMRMLLSIIKNTVGALGNLCIVLIIVVYIFAVLGKELFAGTYTEDVFGDDIPRWNFNNIWYALMLIFRVLCGEWIEPLWDCMRANGEICLIVFMPTLLLGNFMVLNLFLALLINSFSNDQSGSPGGAKADKDDSKMKQGWKKIKNLFKSKKSAVEPGEDRKPSIADLYLEMKRQQTQEDIVEKGEGIEEKQPEASPHNGGVSMKDSKPGDDKFKTDRKKFSTFGKAAAKQSKNEKKDSVLIDNEINSETADGAESAAEQKKKLMKEIDEPPPAEETLAEVDVEHLDDCFPACCYKNICSPCADLSQYKWGVAWLKFRKVVAKIVAHKAFEAIIIIVIIASSITLMVEDIYIYREPVKKLVLEILNYVFLGIFIVEMILKMIALGFKKYFTGAWTILDFIIVSIGIISIIMESPLLQSDTDLSVLRVLRTLRALRPLRAISRWQAMRIVVNALMYAIPAIVNVFFVVVIFWLIFAIMSMDFLGGKFYKCVDANGAILLPEVCPNKTVCLNNSALGWQWRNSKIHFDDIGNSFLALFQVATFEGWMEVIQDAQDSPAVIGDQPRPENNGIGFHLLFYSFIFVGSFFTLNLFIGVIIDNFNMLKKKYEGGYLDMFLTSSQKNYYNTMKKLGNKKPQKTIKRPKNKIQGFFFDVSMSNKFELAIVILIFLNMICMSLEHYKQSQGYTDALDILNIVFTTIFALEAVVKVIGMRYHYFRRAWNVFDFIIVILSVLGVILDDLLKNVFITPTLLRVVRVFRIGRVLRLIKVAKGLRKLLFALVISLPALFNIGMLLFLIIMIWAIFMMNFFGFVRMQGFIDDVTNFQTFPNSIVLLFRLTTAAGWNDILDSLMFEEDDGCDPNYVTIPDTGEVLHTSVVGSPKGDCGNKHLAAAFVSLFVALTYLIIINMYIAVILENFNQAHEQEEVGITEDDFEMFYVVWERYDPHATQFIKYEQLSDFVGDLEQPLGIPKPNEIALVAFDLPIYEGDRLHCLDILISLVKHVLGGVEETEEFKELKSQMEEKYKEIFPTRVQQVIRSSTMFRKKEDVAAKTLQRAWRKHKAQKSIRKITEMAMEAKLARERAASMSQASGGQPSPAASVASPAKNNPAGNASKKDTKNRPPSASSTRSFRSIKSANAKKRSGHLLKVPAANTISLPSDKDV